MSSFSDSIFSNLDSSLDFLGSALIVDSGDPTLDAELSGYLPVITGFHDQVLYPVASPGLLEA